jgi:hypothetical protein
MKITRTHVVNNCTSSVQDNAWSADCLSECVLVVLYKSNIFSHVPSAALPPRLIAVQNAASLMSAGIL